MKVARLALLFVQPNTRHRRIQYRLLSDESLEIASEIVSTCAACLAKTLVRCRG